MNETSQFSIDPSGKAAISGPLTLNTVTALYEKARNEAARGLHIVDLDLDKVPSVDSSGLALLLEWQASADRGLHIRNAPADLLSLVNLCEASDLLTIDGRNQTQSTKQGAARTGQDASS